MILLKEKQTGDLIRILEIEKLIDPFESKVQGRNQAGEEEQPPMDIEKSRLLFPSGESLPECWMSVKP